MGENGSEGIKVASVLLILLGVISAVFLLYTISMRWITKGTSQIGTTMSGLDDTNKSIYDNMTISGKEVISVINTYYNDQDMQIMVCTKDGTNIIYTTAPQRLQHTDPTDTNDPWTGYPTADCRGNFFLPPETGGSASNMAVIKLCSADANTKKLITQAGYNSTVDPSVPGYILESGKFMGSIQKNSNGTVKQITFLEI